MVRQKDVLLICIGLYFATPKSCRRQNTKNELMAWPRLTRVSQRVGSLQERTGVSEWAGEDLGWVEGSARLTPASGMVFDG